MWVVKRGEKERKPPRMVGRVFVLPLGAILALVPTLPSLGTEGKRLCPNGGAKGNFSYFR